MALVLDPEHQEKLDAGSACLQAGLEYRFQLGWCAVGVCDPHHLAEPRWHIGGCHSPGKSPIGKWKELQERLVSEQQLRDYWQHHPTRNVGMICGQVSGVIWIDADGERGLNSLLKDAGLTALPVTPTSENSLNPDSRHFCFKLPPGLRIQSSTRNDPSVKHNGYSILAERAHCVLPPSRHANGGVYRWLHGLSPFQVPIAEMPEELLALCQREYQRVGSGSGPSTVQEFPIAELRPILKQCAFLRHVRDDAATLGYDDWFAGLQVIAHCQNGPELAHQFSAPYSGYTYDETQAKVEEILSNCRPRTCASLESLGDYCHGCVARINGCHSPIGLGMTGDHGAGYRRSAASSVFNIGPLELVPEQSRKTAAKIVVSVEVRRKGRPVDRLRLSDAESSRKSFGKAVRRHLGDVAVEHCDEVEAVTAALLVDVYAQLSRSEPSNGADMRSIVAAEVKKHIDLVYLERGGKAFDRMSGRAVARNAFVERFTSNVLLALAATASDAPRLEDGQPNRAATLTALERELRLLWGDLTRELSGIEHADLGPASNAAQAFRGCVVRAWTKVSVMSINKHAVSDHTADGDSVQLAHSGTLIQLVQENMCRPDLVQGAQFIPDDRWREIKAGRKAWFRRTVGEDGRLSLLLGMRYELLGQLNIELPEGVIDQKSFRRLGVKYGVFADRTGVSEKVEAGETRIVVLSVELVDELLADPNAMADDATDDGLQRSSVAPPDRPSVTDARTINHRPSQVFHAPHAL